jgi:hypothetical protein
MRAKNVLPVDERNSRTGRGRFGPKAKVSVRFTIRQMNVEEIKNYKTALEFFLRELVTQRLGRRE